MRDKWFDVENVTYKCGLEYDTALIEKHPDMDASKAGNNDSTCSVCCEPFDENDKKALEL